MTNFITKADGLWSFQFHSGEVFICQANHVYMGFNPQPPKPLLFRSLSIKFKDKFLSFSGELEFIDSPHQWNWKRFTTNFFPHESQLNNPPILNNLKKELFEIAQEFISTHASVLNDHELNVIRCKISDIDYKLHDANYQLKNLSYLKKNEKKIKLKKKDLIAEKKLLNQKIKTLMKRTKISGTS